MALIPGRKMQNKFKRACGKLFRSKIPVSDRTTKKHLRLRHLLLLTMKCRFRNAWLYSDNKRQNNKPLQLHQSRCLSCSQLRKHQLLPTKRPGRDWALTQAVLWIDSAIFLGNQTPGRRRKIHGVHKAK